MLPDFSLVKYNFYLYFCAEKLCIIVVAVVGVVNAVTYREFNVFNPAAIGTDATTLVYQGINIPVISSGGLFSHLNILQSLLFFNTDVASIQSSAFEGLSTLNRLDLSGNSIDTLEEGIFQGLDSLTQLELDNNFLNDSSLDSAAWAEISDTLRVLDLISNHFTYLKADTFANFSSLERLYLGFNNISTIENGTFNGLTSLTVLDLSGNRITSLPSGVFIDLTSLLDLSLSNNLLTEIEPGTFQGLVLISTLYLANNQLTTLEWNVFEPTDYVLYAGHPGAYPSLYFKCFFWGWIDADVVFYGHGYPCFEFLLRLLWVSKP